MTCVGALSKLDALPISPARASWMTLSLMFSSSACSSSSIVCVGQGVFSLLCVCSLCFLLVFLHPLFVWVGCTQEAMQSLFSSSHFPALNRSTLCLIFFAFSLVVCGVDGLSGVVCNNHLGSMKRALCHPSSGRESQKFSVQFPVTPWAMKAWKLNIAFAKGGLLLMSPCKWSG